MGKMRALLHFVGWGVACRDCEIWNIPDCEECLAWAHYHEAGEVGRG